MKVLMPVLHYYPVIGGLETWTQNIAERLSDKAEIFVVTGRVHPHTKRAHASLFGAFGTSARYGVEVKIFRTSPLSLKNLSYSSPIYILTALPFIFLKSLFLIKKEKIGLLHCQGFLSSLLGYLLSKICRIPYIVTVQRQESKNWLKIKIYRRANCCIAASWYIVNYFKEIGVKEENIGIIPNGIDLERFRDLNRQKSREKVGLNGEFAIMTVARLEKVKGIDYLIEAMAMGELSKINCRLLIIGEGSERKNLENLVEKLGLKDRVKFLGQIPNEKIPEYLAAADCFVLPSLKEGFGIAVLEARAVGVPVIGTRVGGILDIIEDQRNGVLIEPRDSEAIVRAIFKIYSQPEFAKNLVQNAQINLEKYDWQNIAGRVHQLYQKALCPVRNLQNDGSEINSKHD